MRNLTVFIIAPIFLLIFLLFITDAANAAGGVLIFYLVMLASRAYEKYKRAKAENDQHR
ncbi:hypothetical protein [Salinicoccus carnicancri]|uniref:hypothetical protein n=1 Tax=Salinicoccus carnicancri TaxID=558170 RepID=UPI0002EC5D19|nr:hypothetical protein [Salinicoccus carnicancri]